MCVCVLALDADRVQQMVQMLHQSPLFIALQIETNYSAIQSRQIKGAISVLESFFLVNIFFKSKGQHMLFMTDQVDQDGSLRLVFIR